VKIQFIFLLALSACSQFDQIAECDEQAGLTAIEADNLSSAYEALKGCAYTDASGKALHDLHILIFPEGFGSYKSEDQRIIDSQRLNCRAALAGYEVSVSSLAHTYLYGSSYMSVNPIPEVSLCLSTIPAPSASEYVNPGHVEACLSLNPDIDPTYECY